MKFVKGVALFVVLCLAAFGTYTLFKKPPQLDVPESDISYLEDLGIHVQGGRASESGLSGVLNDVQGVAPVGASMGTSSSSAPPSIFAEPATSIADPFDAAPAFNTPTALEAAPPFDAAPRVAAADTLSVGPLSDQTASEFSSPESVVLPSQNVVVPPAGDSSTLVPLTEAPAFDAPATPVTLTPLPEQSPHATTWETWDGPASTITTVPSPAEPFQPSVPAPSTELFAPANEQVTLQPIEKSIRRISSDSSVQRPISVVRTEVPPVNRSISQHAAPQGVTPQSIPTYTRTSARQPLIFSPVKPENSPNAPVVAFGHPKRYTSEQQRQPAESIQPDLPVHSSTQVAVAQPTVPQPSQSAAHESVVQFVQSQRQLINSGSPENTRLAFIQLSQLYEHSLLGEPERALILPLLDSLALKVVYSKDSHILEAPYRVKPDDTADSIAKEFNLTPALLRKMNGLSHSQEPLAGTTLKVVYGQFDARVSIKRREITLLLGGLYAGRFAFSSSQQNIPLHSGESYVTSKTPRTIMLNNGWVLATASTPNATIVLNDKDAQEIFDILSEQSVIVLE